jgi:hypothetical protein
MSHLDTSFLIDSVGSQMPQGTVAAPTPYVAGSYLDTSALLDAYDPPADAGRPDVPVAPSGNTAGSTAGSTTNADAAFGVAVGAQIVGNIMSQIGAYASAQGQIQQARTGALTSENRAVLDRYGAAQVRQSIASVRSEGVKKRGRYALRSAQAQSANNARTASRGVATNSGSAAEVKASMKLVQKVDELTMDSNMLTQIQALERREQAMRRSAEMNDLSALNQRDMAGSISSGLAVATAAMQGIATVAGSFASHYRA